ncbi:hypothetical protein O3P69_000889 [Scylla paramamosain]|uniref:Uncharacterized protein n=1 Tax=Scylla paramamosain TaxID=85552 RepID=A0AAW0UX91_SCYPA
MASSAVVPTYDKRLWTSPSSMPGGGALTPTQPTIGGSLCPSPTHLLPHHQATPTPTPAPPNYFESVKYSMTRRGVARHHRRDASRPQRWELVQYSTYSPDAHRGAARREPSTPRPWRRRYVLPRALLYHLCGVTADGRDRERPVQQSVSCRDLSL